MLILSSLRLSPRSINLRALALGFYGKDYRLTSLIGTSVPRIRLTSRITSYTLGRCCGFSLSIHAVQISNNAWTIFDKH